MNKNVREFNKEFADIKRKVFERDNWRCQSEFSEFHFGPLTVDHIRKRSLKGTSNKLENLITLCVGCHSIYEAMPNQIKEEKLKKLLEQVGITGG